MTINQLGYHETLLNNVQTELDGAISNSDTTITVGSGPGFPTSGFFRCLIEDEIIIFNGRSGNDLNAIQRGAEGTSAVSHSDNTPVQAVLTAGGIQRFMLDHRATVYTEESTNVSTPHNRFLDETNSILTVSDFTWVNQGSATATDVNGAIYMTVPDEASPNLRMLVLTAPSTPYRVLVKIQLGVAPGTLANNGTSAGPLFRESSSGKVINATPRYGGRLAFLEFTNATTFSASVDTNQSFHEDAIWISIEDNGTDLFMRASEYANGFSRTDSAWWRAGRTAFMAGGPDQIGLYINSGNNSGNSGAGSAVAHATFEAFRVEEL